MRSNRRTVSFLVLVATVLVVGVSAQYGHYRPYPMSMPASGFSPYHPARINHETLPISQAEFAQLVAESMATSNGPHHHHPPNTDADYEAADHYRSYHNGGGRRQSHAQHSHHQPPSSSPYQQYHHQQQEQYEPQEQHHGGDSGYQPDENEHEYPRQAVYEKDGADVNEEDDEVESNSYGGRPGAYEEGYDEAGQGGQEVDHAGPHHQAGGEPGQEQYMAASAPMVQRYRYVVDTHK